MRASKTGYAAATVDFDATGVPIEDLEVVLEPTQGVYLAVALDTGRSPGRGLA